MVDEYNHDDALRCFQRGRALERANRIKEAVHEYHQALTAYPHLPEAHHALGVYYQRCGMLARAAEAFRIAANLAGDFRSFFSLGYVLARLEQYDEALNAFKHCLALSPNDPATRYEVCTIMCARGEYQQALDQLPLPVKRYADDWALYLLRGNCYLGLGHNDEALAAFGKALQLTDSVRAQAAIISRMMLVEGHQELRRPRTASDQTFSEEGVMYLGSAQDGSTQGINIQHYHFTYPDIGTTLQRLRILHQSHHWPLTAIVALDKLAQPLAAAISRILGVPLRNTNQLHADDTALLVLAVAREAELLQLTIERIPAHSISFCLGLNWLRHSRLLPEIIGVAASHSCSVPWEAELRRLRSDGAPSALVDACLQRATSEILAAVHDVPFDTSILRQTRSDIRSHRRSTLPISTTPPGFSSRQ